MIFLFNEKEKIPNDSQELKIKILEQSIVKINLQLMRRVKIKRVRG